MKVWVAFSGSYEQRGVTGVYAKKEDAIAVTMPAALSWRRQMEQEIPDRKWKPVGEDDCDVEEWEVIGEPPAVSSAVSNAGTTPPEILFNVGSRSE